jgi:hypothetical protein
MGRGYPRTKNAPRTGKRRGQDEDEKGKLWLKRKKMKAKGKKRNLATDKPPDKQRSPDKRRRGQDEGE